MLATVSNFILASGPTGSEAGLKIQTFLSAFVGPILLVVIGIIAIKFLMQRQMTQFFQFLAIAVLVGVLFFVPTLVQTIARWIGGVASGFFGP